MTVFNDRTRLTGVRNDSAAAPEGSRR